VEVKMRILFATDGSEYSQRAAAFLTRFHFSGQDEIYILHASPWVPIMSEWEFTTPELHEIREMIVPKILSSAREILSQLNVRIHTLYEEEYPERAILRKADELDVAMVVMGASGRRGVSAKIVGSVAKSVATKIHRPVFIIKPGVSSSERLRVLFATDGSRQSEAVIDLLASLPFPTDSELILLSVLSTDYLGVPDHLYLELDDRAKDIIATLQEKERSGSVRVFDSAEERLKHRFNTISRLVRTGDPAEEIIRVAGESGADIVALGSSGKRKLLGLVGSVSRYVLHHAGCSLLIARH